MKSAGISDLGRERAGNEDSILMQPGDGLFVVCDGMGGHQAGEVASKAAVESLGKTLAGGEPPADAADIHEAILIANRAIFGRGQADPSLEGMGTTLVMVQYGKGILRFAHVGDSRLYLLRDGGGAQLTTDHRVVQELIDRGQLDEEGARTHPMRNVLTRSLGVDETVEPDVEEMALQPGDRLLLCSDGLSDLIVEPKLYEMMGDGKDAKKICQKLVDQANEAGGHDNISAILLIAESSDF